MALDWIPGLSQVKSTVQLLSGDEDGANRTLENFFRLCPGVSQVTSAVKLMTGDAEGALETQKAFLGNAWEVVDAVPGLSHGKVFAQAFSGRHHTAGQTMNNVFSRTPVVSQLQSLIEVTLGHKEAARWRQLEFCRNLGIPLPHIKNFYHYTSQEGAWAIGREGKIRESHVQKGDAFFGSGVYFTSLDPRHFSRNEVLKNNYGSNRFPDKADYVVEVWFPKDDIHRVTSARDVYLYNGDVDLEDFPCYIFINTGL